METSDKEKFWQKYKSLPYDLQEAIFSEDTQENISFVLKKNGVSDGDLETAFCQKMGNVLLGIMPPDLYMQEIKKTLAGNPQTADKVVTEINERVFYPLRDSLEKLYKIKLAVPAALERAQTKPVAASPAKTTDSRVIQAVCPPCPPCVKTPAKPKISQPVILKQAPAPKPVLRKPALPIPARPRIQPQDAPQAKNQPQQPQQQPQNAPTLSASPNAMRRRVF